MSINYSTRCFPPKIARRRNAEIGGGKEGGRKVDRADARHHAARYRGIPSLRGGEEAEGEIAGGNSQRQEKRLLRSRRKPLEAT